jgi:hypothetical protein
MELSELIQSMEHAGLDTLTIHLTKTDAKEATESKPAVESQTMVVISADGLSAQDVDPDKAVETVIGLQASVAIEKAKHHAKRLDHWAEINRRLTPPKEETKEVEEEPKPSAPKKPTHKPSAPKKR